MNSGGVVRSRRSVPTWWTVVMCCIAVATALSCGALLWQNTVDGPIERLLVAFVVLGAVGVLWLSFGIVGLVAFRGTWLTVVAPLIVVLTAVLGGTGTAQRFGWSLSKPDFERAAQTCEPSTTDQRIGLFTVTEVHQEDGGCLFRTPGGFIGSVGYAYLPGGAPEPTGEYDETYRPYDGVWYRFSGW
ncbi:hypothetical protein ACSVDM_01855 [Nocardia sp. JW2]|uniref:hypothetical protein n=1 Tax=Nocardia sp. JW2 TaxID=3450738 RepID=UPI003F439DC4